uniref:RCC1 and BTB domain-containing protein 1 n=1 Tax=Lygus hesperus TaxID=30085 RepID=A0A146LEI6_LYGHE
MIVENLRLWPVLHHLSKESLLDIVYLVIYGDKGPSDYGTALYITRNGDVFACGINSYCGKYSMQTEIIKHGGNFLEGSMMVKELSGIELKKIVQSSEFGAGLSANNNLYLWGNASSSIMLGKEYIVMYECYTPDTVCKKCSTSEYSPSTIGGFDLNKCTTCDWYPTYSLQSPNSPQTPVKTFMEFCDMVVVLCSKCGQWCSFVAVGAFDLYYCTPCNALQESIGWCEESTAPRKVQLDHSLKVVDVACGMGFLVLQTASNNLIVFGYLGCNFQGYIDNLDNVVIQNFTCGGHHLAVVTNKGALYTCGDGSSGQLGYDWNEDMGYTTLRKVSLPGTTVKVCCGLSSTACLLSDGSVAFFGGNNAKQSITMLKQYTFIDIACATLTDLFSAKTASSGVYFWRSPTPKLHLKVDACDCIEALLGWPVTYDRALSEILFLKQTLPCNKHGFSHYAEFYGQKQFSDLTLKLKDGDFPAHRIVLFNNSAYYKKLLTESADFQFTDMTSHDPHTYRNLLKYFYQALVKELSWQDLLNLYVLAVNCNENEVVEYTFRRLLDKLDKENIDEITRVAKSKELSALLAECHAQLERMLQLTKNETSSNQESDATKTNQNDTESTLHIRSS